MGISKYHTETLEETYSDDSSIHLYYSSYAHDAHYFGIDISMPFSPASTTPISSPNDDDGEDEFELDLSICSSNPPIPNPPIHSWAPYTWNYSDSWPPCWQPIHIFHCLISCLHQCFTNIDFSSQISNERRLYSLRLFARLSSLSLHNCKHENFSFQGHISIII
jgi:hypothetical protein